jgi:hypothetical protein
MLRSKLRQVPRLPRAVHAPSGPLRAKAIITAFGACADAVPSGDKVLMTTLDFRYHRCMCVQIMRVSGSMWCQHHIGLVYCPNGFRDQSFY